MFKYTNVLYLFWFLALSNLVHGAEPFAKISGPQLGVVGRDIVMSLSGSESSLPLEYEIALAPENSVAHLVPLYSKENILTYVMVVPDQPGIYRFAVISSAQDPNNKDKIIRKYGFHDVLVKSVPDPVLPPAPVVPPAPSVPPTPSVPPAPEKPQVDGKYGLYSFCKGLLVRIPNNGSWKSEAPGVASVFSGMANKGGSYQDPNKFVLDTSSSYKSYLKTSYPFWSQYFFESLKAQLAVLNGSGRLGSDVPSHVEAWREISEALGEVK